MRSSTSGGASTHPPTNKDGNVDVDVTISMSQHLSEQVSTFIDPDASVERKIQVCDSLEPYVQQVDGYLSFSSVDNDGESESTPSSSTEGQWPVLEWNAHFRKAYSILLWVRPVLGNERFTTVAEDDQLHLSSTRRVLYRFGTSLEDSTSVGVCVTIGDWRAVEEVGRTNDIGNGSTPTMKRKLMTNLTAFSLPHVSVDMMSMHHHHPLAREDNDHHNDNSDRVDDSAFVTASLELVENEWAMIGITHVFPYLKRPHWTICVNGRHVSGGELAYPVLEKTPVMNFNTLFLDPVKGGCQLIRASLPSSKKDDTKKKASELQSLVHPRHELKLHLATFLLSNEAFTPTVQALLAQAGPTMSLENGGCLPSLPPVANWSKGSSLEGPNVGIPLVVHGQALRVQQLSAACVLWGSSVEARLMGGQRRGGTGSESRVQRITCRMSIKRGTTHTAPRVGLIQPTPPHINGTSSGARTEPSHDRYNDSPISLTVVGGGCSIHHNLSNYLLRSAAVANVDTHLFSTSKFFSLLLLQGQAFDCHVLLPFFLALPPPGTTMNLQMDLLTQSLQHLYDLYINDAALASRLIRLFTASIRMGGGRWQEELLQNGSLHVLATSLRQALVRAEFLHVQDYSSSSYTEFVKAQAATTTTKNIRGSSGGQNRKPVNNMTTPMSQLPISPTKISLPIIEAMVDLLDACCGPPSMYLEDLDPSLQIQRTSDLALTAVFGIALDWDLWGRDLRAACGMLEALAERYGGVCVTSGYIVRSQISVQYFLDTLKYRLQKVGTGLSAAASSSGNNIIGSKQPRNQQREFLRRISNACAKLLQAMLLSSLSNTRSISQAEHDISACMGSLSDCPMGTFVAHVVFRALLGVLQWCEIVPPNLTAEAPDSGDSDRTASSWINDAAAGTQSYKSRVDDDHKCQVASRLARNLLMSQFHDVIAPMLLSRTVFSGERTMEQAAAAAAVAAAASSASSNDGSSLTSTRNNGGASSNSTSTGSSSTFGGVVPLSWQEDWRLGLLIFSWVSSIAGSEGVFSAKSLGSLLLASGLTGSLQGAIEGASKAYVSNLFLPAPSMALTVVATSRKNEWSYIDLLSDRLAVMMPILPSLVVSLLAPPTDAQDSHTNATISATSLTVLAELITAVGGAFYRVFGGMTHSAGNKRNRGWLAVDSTAVQTAKGYVPHLLVVTMILENHIVLLKRNQMSDDSAVTILRAPAMAQKGVDDGSWVEVSSTVNESFLSDGAVRLPEGRVGSAEDNEAVVAILAACQTSVLTTISELMSNAMRAGGGEASTLMWRSILMTLKESECYQAKEKVRGLALDGNPLADNVLCRMLAMVLMKCLKRDYQWELWTLTLSSAISRLCLLVEEKELLYHPLGRHKKYSDDQVVLICSFLNVLSYGRDTTGWCQLTLPSPPLPTPQYGEGDFNFLPESSGSRGAESAAAAAKVMLPVLQPTMRVMVECLGNLSSSAQIIIPKAAPFDAAAGSANPKVVHDEEETVGLLKHIATELRHSLMAAIVGMAFPNSRDVALHAMATLRRAIHSYQNSADSEGGDLCTMLLCMTAEEIRVRYEGERRRRETALFDAYEGHDDAMNKSSKNAAADSQAVENLILGGALVPLPSEIGRTGGRQESIEEVDFEAIATVNVEDEKSTPKLVRGEDFVLFHDGLSQGSTSSKAKMEWSRYEGFGAALEKCSAMDGVPIDHESNDLKSAANLVLDTLSPFLDAWDENAAVEAVDTELVKLFDFNLATADNGCSSIQEGTELEVYRLEGSDNAADAMSSFIELAAAEKSRMVEVTGVFIPNQRYSCVSFTERFCWARYMEMRRKGSDDHLWERGVADGNRDIRSRLVTIPCSPQFKRYIPKYLDHSAENRDSSPNIRTSEINFNEAEEAYNIDEFTKNLIKTGHLQIVDITKKEINEEDEPAIPLPNADALDDYFDETPLEGATPSDERTNKADGESESTTATEEAPATKDDIENDSSFDKTKMGSSHFNITASAFASPPDNSSSTLGLMHSSATGLIERHLENCLHVKAEGSRKCSMLLTSTHLILEYDVESEGLYDGELLSVREEAERQQMIDECGGNNGGDEDRIQEEMERRQKEIAALRPKSIRWNLSELSHVYLRRYRLRDSSVELFFIPSGGTSYGGYGLYSPSSSLFLDFGPGYEGNVRRDDAASAIMKRAPPQAIKQMPDRAGQFLHEQLSRLTIGWVEGRITNFDYLLHLNMLAGRSYNDTCQYPVMPWVLSNYTSREIPDLTDPKNFRDLTKPVGALNPNRLEDFIDRFNTFADPSIPPFMYGSHYSTNAGVVLHFLVRLHPFAGLHRQLQGGHFDVADRLFSSVPRTWEMCTGSSAAEVKELTPEWYCNPAFLKNTNNFKLGTSQDGDVLGDVVLPPWANGSPEKFVEVMRNALESDICSAMLPDWVDLIFGRKQQGPEAIAAHNVFFYLTYYGSVDVAAIQDEGLRQATELQIAHFGQCPMQLFVRPHVRRLQYVNKKRLSFYQIVSAYTHGVEKKAGRDDENDSESSQIFGPPLYLPFFSVPTSHRVHLDAPPPGPHAHLLCVRLAGTDRCLAVDTQGVFHCFRWAWKAEEPLEVPGYGGARSSNFPIDNGCFVAQRELPRFRAVPRLVHKTGQDEIPAVAISKTLFAGRTVLLVLSDGDGRGGLAMQLVDPAKGEVRSEAVIGSVHASNITCIATDPVGTAAGHGGVGGELAIVGSSDGSASVWRFMSSHYLPLRPRVRLSGHGGCPIHAVGLSAAIHVAVTVSANRLCLHSLGNGCVIRVIDPPKDTLDLPEDRGMVTTFAKTPAVAISVQGFVVAVCETKSNTTSRSVITLHLFSMEGVSLGSKPLESWRGVPQKISATPDGTAVLICSGRGVTIHRLSAITPLEFIDEWHVADSEEISSNVARAWDIDLGPSLNRPVVAAAACSNGILRLHALAGISAFSERHKKIGISQSVGSLMAAPARRLKNAFGKASAIGTKAAGVGKEISKEITTDVKERGVTGFLGGMFTKKK